MIDKQKQQPSDHQMSKAKAASIHTQNNRKMQALEPNDYVSKYRTRKNIKPS